MTSSFKVAGLLVLLGSFGIASAQAPDKEKKAPVERKRSFLNDNRFGEQEVIKPDELERQLIDRDRDETDRKQQKVTDDGQKEKKKTPDNRKDREAKERQQQEKGDSRRKAIESYFGLKTPRDLGKAFRLFKQAADEGDDVARGMLGRMVYSGEGTKADEAAGERLMRTALPGLKRAIKNGDTCAMFLLGGMCFSGIVVDEDKTEADKLLQAAAKKGFAPAIHLTAGKAHIEKDYTTEAECYRKAADLGYAPSMIALGCAYARGEGVKADDAEAVKWHLRAAQNRDPQGSYHLALHLDVGRGVKRDGKAALKLYREAAEQGVGKAMTMLGVLYQVGRLVEQSDREAAHWFTRGSLAGESGSMKRLGNLYALGKGVGKDSKKAYVLHLRAACAGEADSMYILGLMYEHGVGTSKNSERSLKWLRMAAARGHLKAKEKMQNVEQ